MLSAAKLQAAGVAAGVAVVSAAAESDDGAAVESLPAPRTTGCGRCYQGIQR
jgi:hypothetical protein